jgi:hypothetical protein
VAGRAVQGLRCEADLMAQELEGVRDLFRGHLESGIQNGRNSTNVFLGLQMAQAGRIVRE